MKQNWELTKLKISLWDSSSVWVKDEWGCWTGITSSRWGELCADVGSFWNTRGCVTSSMRLLLSQDPPSHITETSPSSLLSLSRITSLWFSQLWNEVILLNFAVGNFLIKNDNRMFRSSHLEVDGQGGT